LETSGEKLASPTRYRMTGIVNLHDTRHGSEKAKDDCKNKYQNCDLEDVPLDPFTPVGQPLSEDFGLRVIVSLRSKGGVQYLESSSVPMLEIGELVSSAS